MAKEPMVYLSFMVPADQRARLDREAERSERSLGDVAREWLRRGEPADKDTSTTAAPAHVTSE